MIGKITFAIETLKICLGKEKSAEALIAVENIVLVTEEDLSAAEIGLWDLKELTTWLSYSIVRILCSAIDLTISRVFDGENGLLSFLKKSLRSNKLFKDANVKTLQFFQKLIKDHPAKAKHYAESIIEVWMCTAGDTAIKKGSFFRQW